MDIQPIRVLLIEDDPAIAMTLQRVLQAEGYADAELKRFAAEHRIAAGVAGGETHEVTLTHDTSPRDTPVPDDLAAAIEAAGLREAFAALAPSHRKEHVRSVTDAKAETTRQRRIEKVIDALR